MGFLDDFASAMTGGAEAVSRSMGTARMRKQLDELAASRRDLAAQLGEALLDVVRNDPDLYKQYHEMVDVMDKIEVQRAAIISEIAAAEAQASWERTATTILECPKCGRRVFSSQAYCTGCGTPTSIIKDAMKEAGAAVSGKEPIACAQCGARLNAEDMYCMDCGARRE